MKLVLRSDSVEVFRRSHLKQLYVEAYFLRKVVMSKLPELSSEGYRRMDVNGCIFEVNPSSEVVLKLLKSRLEKITRFTSLFTRALDIIEKELGSARSSSYVLFLRDDLLEILLYVLTQIPNVIPCDLQPNDVEALKVLYDTSPEACESEDAIKPITEHIKGAAVGVERRGVEPTHYREVRDVDRSEVMRLVVYLACKRSTTLSELRSKFDQSLIDEVLAIGRSLGVLEVEGEKIRVRDVNELKKLIKHLLR
ncbi:MAG: hypothetical protein DRJ40_05850 [Thermoprotei archaeon]|nr:MAG: hypothetical protein DRJ40_05850 [Thermoprotei archaeon]